MHKASTRKRKSSCKGEIVVELVDCSTHVRKVTKKKKAKRSTEDSDLVNSELSSKSVLCLSGELDGSCLLFLTNGQKVCIRGKAELTLLAGDVQIFGYRIQQEDCKSYQIFSPSTSSLVTLQECGNLENASSFVQEKGQIKNILKAQESDVVKKGTQRAKKAAAILLFQSFTNLETDFVCQFPLFQGIFKGNITEEGVEDTLTGTERLLLQKTTDLGFILLDPEPARFPVFTCPDQWVYMADTIQETLDKTPNGGRKSLVILLCGGKNVGKSTFARYLMNSALNKIPEVFFLECDTGQTEFTPPALLSLNRITSPIFGPPFTHLSQPEKSCFFGDVTPRDSPQHYIRCIQYLYQFYVDKCNGKLLVINTQGWVSGMGVPLLLDIIRTSRPSHIVQFKSSSHKDLPSLTAEILATEPGWLHQNSSTDAVMRNPKLSITFGEDQAKEAPLDPVIIQLDCFSGEDTITGSKLRAPDYRTLALLSYFSCLSEGRPLSNGGAWPLASCVPFKIPWKRVAVHVMHTEVSCGQVLYSLNASIVGLAVTDPSKMRDRGEGAPKFLDGVPVTECVGLGIVRNIDPVNKMFFILTPVPQPDLKRVNTLLKGNLEIPAAMFLQTERANSPYVSSEFSYEFRGAGARKVRYNLLRRKHASPGRSPISS